MTAVTGTPDTASQDGPWRVFLVFLRLGLTSFGGPIAHLGFFRTEFVARRRWLSEEHYADVVALSQFLPGPASSKVGIMVGVLRAGMPGALAAWLGFTLPSALALIAFGYGVAAVGDLAGAGWLHGLKIVAVAVVAQAVWGMAKNLCPDRARAGIAIVAALLILALPTALTQVGVIALAGLVGWRLLALAAPLAVAHQGYRVSRRAGVVALVLFFALLAGLPFLAVATGSLGWRLVDGFYRAGALVFGGGHVVLPLLQATVVPAGVVSNAQFLAGYGAAQAVPGPLFTFAAYLGAVMQGPLSGWQGGLAMLLVIFLPAFLLVVAALPFWEALRHRAGVQSAMAGVNAAVVGILLAALYDPVWTSAIGSRADFAVALAAFALLVVARLSPVLVVLLAAAAGAAFLG